MTTELDHRLAEHEGFSKKLMALLTARMSDHRDQSERMRERLDHARESLGDIGTEEVSLKAEVVELQRDLTSTEETIRVRQQDRAQTDSEIQATEEEMKSVIGV